jgi:3-deoxy-D-manno-octulosonic-acid transferase
MARWIYTLIFYLAIPLVFLRLLWRARRQPEYLRHLGERFGAYPTPTHRPVIWVHAVSVGETRAAQPLIEALRQQLPSHDVLLTTMTPTGRAAAREVFGDSVIQAYLPYDLPFAVNRFFAHFSPDSGVLMETEIWPNLLAGAQRKKIPVVLVNARLSARSARGYQRLRWLLAPAWESLRAVAAQTAEDGQRLAMLGARHVAVCGNLKFDVAPASELLALGQAWRAQLGGRPVWLAASTRDGEESLVLAAWRILDRPDALLVIVPRHPQRFSGVAGLLASEGIAFVSRSEQLPDAATQVWLGDSMGEMAAYYGLADLAFVGGSLLPLGGQNLIEAAACACPVLVGPHTFNFTKATEDALTAGAARRIADSAALAQAVGDLLSDRQGLAAMRQAAIGFAAAHRGATAKTLTLIQRVRRQAGR